MTSPSLPRLALLFALAVSSLSLHAACARSVPADLGGDGAGLFAPDAGGVAKQNLCVATECPAPFATCPRKGPCATNLSNDVEHCGSCDTACPSNLPSASAVCSGGQCHVVCDPLSADCNGSIADGCETATESDPLNCGSCHNACKDGDLCWRGACGCPNGYAACGTECKKIDSDDQNCGSCGNVCHAPADPADPAWICGPSVTPGHTKWQCLSSSCALSCEPGYGDCNKDFCGDGCEHRLVDDPDNCGACGHKCDAGQTCDHGSCLCPPGMTNCSGTCVDLQTDIYNCGSCDRWCPGPSGRDGRHPGGGSAVCEGGHCSYVCFPGFADCDGRLANGCEVNILNNPYHCGGCETQCNIPAGQPCIVGKCLTKECEAGVVF